MDFLVEQQTNFNSPSKITPPGARRKSTEAAVEEATAAQKSGKCRKNIRSKIPPEK